MAENEHALQQLRKATEQRLRDRISRLTVVSRLRAERGFQSNEIPLATVQAADVGRPVSTGGSVSGKPVRRDCTVVIQLMVQGDPDTVEDDLSALQVEVEAALDGSDPILRGVNDWFYGGCIPPVGDPEAGTAATNLTFTCWLRTDPGKPHIIKF